MPINNRIVSDTGTEIDFISAFITSLIGESAFASHSLVCKINTSNDISTAQEITASNVGTKVSGAFDGSSSGSVNIWFTINSYATIHMVRPAVNNDGAAAYRFYMSLNGNEEFQPTTLTFYIGQGVPYYNISGQRAFAYQIVSNANAVFIVLGGASTNITFPLATSTVYPCTSIFIYSKTVSGSTTWCCGKTIADTLTGTGSQRLQAVTRLPYNNSTDTTAIETIQNKVAVTEMGNQKVVTMENIWDSSYNAVVMNSVNVIVNNQSTECVYLNNYTLMPI